MSLGTNLSRLRGRSGLSQDALAEKIGVSRQSVSKWENDSSVPELEKLIRLAEIFDVTLDELVRDVRPEPEAVSRAGPAEPGEPAAPLASAAPLPEPAAPPASTASPARKIVGIVLLCMGGLVLLLLTVLVGLGGLLAGLIYASPFFACGVICLVCKRRVGLWCGWAVFICVDIFLQLFTSASRGIILASFLNPSLYYGGKMTGQMIIAWTATAALVLLVGLTLWSFRRERLPRKKRTVLLLAAGWAVRLAVLPAVMHTVMRLGFWRELNGYGLLRAVSLLSNLASDALMVVLVVCTVLVLRRRGAG